ncbi:antitoxin [Cereibacter johrii]|uniref:Antitoxin VapB n=2 Tax=Cereibacter TaxID=1653176 RepID=A0ABX5J270_9RHOB|nr:antitoxin [Cereibacter johrii]PTM75298.1 antitoxin VapB [Cereibacter johrii]RAZ84235.1 antitoxin [Cereibacter johrii]RDS95473.1 antitoxin [Cereibacter sphaeroides f. sp. denitrificans]
MERGSVFMNNRTQAIRLPKSVALPEGTRSVDIVRSGRAWLIVPSQDSWAQWFDEVPSSEDFMERREQPDADERGDL